MMRFERITDVSHPMFAQAMALYQESFPVHEQREALSQERILKHPDYHFSLVYDEALWIGLVLYWEQAEYLYIEHLCIIPTMRNKQYGQHVLTLLAEQSKTIILEIDPPVDTISIRRKGFYERCGFTVNVYSHTHPPYHQDCAGHKLVVMTAPQAVSAEMYDAFASYLNQVVMQDAFIQE